MLNRYAHNFQVDIPIYLSTGESTVVTLVGVGYNSDSYDEKNQIMKKEHGKVPVSNQY